MKYGIRNRYHIFLYKFYIGLFKEKITETWPRITIREEQKIKDLLGSKKDNKALDETVITSLKNIFSNNTRKLSYNTTHKRELDVINTQILVMADSKDKDRKENMVKSVCESYKTLDEDNKLIYEPVKSKTEINICKFQIPNVMINEMSTAECKHLVELPGRSLLIDNKNIEKTEILENPVPEELKSGDIGLGVSKYKDTKAKAYFTTDKELSNLTTIIIGPNRSGKSTYIGNYSKDAVNSNQCIINIDFCENCDLSDTIEDTVGQNKCLVIDCSDIKHMQGLGYNEIKSLVDSGTINKYFAAKMMTIQLINFINSINNSDKKMPPKMKRYLKAAAMLVFISGETNIKNVVKCLANYRIRNSYIVNAPQNEGLNEYISTLKELDEKDKHGEVVESKSTNKTDGIFDRIDTLKDNAFMELMYNQSCSNNINFVDEIQKNQAILIKMPEYLFQTQTEKDMAVTYWVSKIWLANQIRSYLVPKDKRTKVACIVDELYQVPYAQAMIRDKLSQCPKFRLRFVLSCHYINQINIIRNELRSSSASYMLIAGCDKKNYEELKEELLPYEFEDLERLPRYYSLNLIKYERGYAKFITQLPPDLNGR